LYLRYGGGSPSSLGIGSTRLWRTSPAPRSSAVVEPSQVDVTNRRSCRCDEVRQLPIWRSSSTADERKRARLTEAVERLALRARMLSGSRW